ncbi:MAG: 30S ribosomal protein S24e [Thermoplasmata archaeon]
MADVEIKSEKENIFLKRKDIQFRVVHDKEPTPTRDVLREKIATVMNVNKELVVVKTIRSIYGKGESLGVAKVYKDIDTLRSVESDYVLKRNKLYVEKKKKEPSSKEKK